MGQLWVRRLAAVALVGAIHWPAGGNAAETIKFALIEPMSGQMAVVGEGVKAQFDYIATRLNAAGGINGKQFEIVAYDNKLNAQETVEAARRAIENGARYLVQGNGSGPAGALLDFVRKYNERNPGQEVLYVDYSSEDPKFTNELCSYWHIRWSPNNQIKMSTLASYVAGRGDVKNIYLINPDYSLGQDARKFAREYLVKERSDISIVGDDLHALAKVSDFSPYIAKIRASGADAVLTTTWGTDLALLLKAASEAGLKVNWFTYFAYGPGAPTAVAQAGLAGRVYAIQEGNANLPNADADGFETEFRKLHPGKGFWYPRARNAMEMLALAMKQAGSDRPLDVAKKLSGLRYEGAYGTVFMRPDDHQAFQDLYISVLVPTAQEGLKFDEEASGLGLKLLQTVPADRTLLPTTCKMVRPE
ncbi:branched-chain amino acid ABC transporter substrate-binding protein [Bradyrhizobium sp. CW7]|uniref:branched-chain amino acid ABC transporter substrate-binding protein n=1 Tax=Bradyrhizobium sp. CW7 TaxID=2782688 RepID=UPI001FFC0A4B|nr:branched-chain amino acid ABC transporter substrate-binding protein [Bradyrhizobium sp. CW7]MCK1356249.1 branched-chain amino acid ABC transporter substrate-binding protein [Bradyrhizobium sp. CW7]